MNKEILEKANAAIARGDFEGFLAHCTDDTTWTFMGGRTLKGKGEVRGWMTETYQKPPKFNLRQMIAEGRYVVALGEITLKDAAGKESSYSYCDVWLFEGGRMATLDAYVVELPRPR